MRTEVATAAGVATVTVGGAGLVLAYNPELAEAFSSQYLLPTLVWLACTAFAVPALSHAWDFGGAWLASKSPNDDSTDSP